MPIQRVESSVLPAFALIPLRKKAIVGRREIHHPHRALTDGILIPNFLFESENLLIPPLATYMKKRTLIAGEVYAQEWESKGKNFFTTFYSDRKGTWRATMTSDTHAINFNKDLPDPKDRKELAKKRFQENSALLQEWTAVRANISEFNTDIQARLRKAIWQQFALDAATVRYAYKATCEEIGKTNPEFVEKFSYVSNISLDILVKFFETQLYPMRDPSVNFNIKNLENFFIAGSHLLDESYDLLKKSDSNNDVIRNHIESLSTYNTLFAAKLFMHEYGKEEPEVLILELGGLANYAALKTLGYNDKNITSILPRLKSLETDEKGKRKIIPLDIPQEVINKLKITKRVVIYEDSITEGNQLSIIVKQLKENGINDIHVRLMMDFCKNEQEREVVFKKLKKHGVKSIKAYLKAPINPEGSRARGSGTIEKATLEQWSKENKFRNN
jgi:hypothetical protein